MIEGLLGAIAILLFMIFYQVTKIRDTLMEAGSDFENEIVRVSRENARRANSATLSRAQAEEMTRRST
jgi:hypothetical protein